MRWAIVIVIISCTSALARAQDVKAWEAVNVLYAKGKVYSGIRKCDHMLAGKAPQQEFLVLRADGLNRIAENERAARDARQAYGVLEGEFRSQAALQLGIAMVAMGAPDTARFWLHRSLGSADDSEAFYRLGLLDKARGACSSAIQSFNTVLARYPDRTNVLIERGACHALEGDTVRARQDLDKAVEIAPRDPVVWNSHGFYLHAQAGRYREAIADYDRAIRFDPNYSYAFNNRGWAFYKLGDTEKALKNIALAGRKKKANPYVQRNLGIIALESGNTDRACSHFRTALDMRFTELHGDEVKELMTVHCGRSTVPAAVPDNAPSKPVAPRTNAPARTNAP